MGSDSNRTRQEVLFRRISLSSLFFIGIKSGKSESEVGCILRKMQPCSFFVVV